MSVKLYVKLCIIALTVLCVSCVTSSQMNALIRENKRLKIENEQLKKEAALSLDINKMPAIFKDFYYTYIFKQEQTRFEGLLKYFVLTNSDYTEQEVSTLQEKTLSLIKQNVIQAGTFSYEELVKLVGYPSGATIFDTERAAYFVKLLYGKIAIVYGAKSVIHEIRFEHPEINYQYKDVIAVQSSIEEVLKYLGQPQKTVLNQPIKFEPNVLYLNPDTPDKIGYLCYQAQGVRFFLKDRQVISIYLFDPKSRL